MKTRHGVAEEPPIPWATQPPSKSSSGRAADMLHENNQDPAPTLRRAQDSTDAGSDACSGQ